MNIMIAAALSLAVCMACENGKQHSTNKSQPENGEWINMVSSLDQWHIYNKPGQAVGKAWSLTDGVLYLDDSKKEKGKIVDGGNLVFNEDFENFHLKLEWKISQGGNSGILFFVKEDTALSEPYYSGSEMQILDNNAHSDASIIKHRAGDLYDLIACSTEVVKPVGDWNLAEIVANKGKLDFYMNGVHVVNTTMWDDNWNNMIEGSKFKGWPHFAKYKSGKVALQDHDNGVWFRNVMIKKL